MPITWRQVVVLILLIVVLGWIAFEQPPTANQVGPQPPASQSFQTLSLPAFLTQPAPGPIARETDEAGT